MAFSSSRYAIKSYRILRKVYKNKKLTFYRHTYVASLDKRF